MKKSVLSIFVLVLTAQRGWGCNHGSDNLRVKAYSEMDEYKAKFLDTSAPNFNSDLSGFVKIIFLTKGTVPEICSDTFNLADLEVLQMNHMGIKTIQQHSFDKMKKLRVINLKANNITAIDNNVFSNLPVKYLLLSNNKIFYIANDAFDNLPNLEIISLGDNQLQEINPLWFKGPDQVRLLSLENNLITHIQNLAFSQLVSSEANPMKLYLNNNKIKRIQPQAFSSLEFLDILDLSHNLLTDLPDHLFDNAIYVKNLMLDYNHIEVNQYDAKTYEKVHNLHFLGYNAVDCGFIKKFLTSTGINKNITAETECTPVNPGQPNNI